MLIEKRCAATCVANENHCAATCLTDAVCAKSVVAHGNPAPAENIKGGVGMPVTPSQLYFLRRLKTVAVQRLSHARRSRIALQHNNFRA